MTLIGGLHLKDRLRAPLCGRFVRVVLDLQSRYSKYKHCIRSNIYETPTCDYGATAIADRRACYSVPVQHSVVRQRMTNLLVSAHRYTIFLHSTTVRLTDIWIISLRYLTLAPTGVRATLVPTGGGSDNRPPKDLENEAS